MDNSKYNYENDEKCDCNLSIEIFIIISFYGKSEFKKARLPLLCLTFGKILFWKVRKNKIQWVYSHHLSSCMVLKEKCHNFFSAFSLWYLSIFSAFFVFPFTKAWNWKPPTGAAVTTCHWWYSRVVWPTEITTNGVEEKVFNPFIDSHNSNIFWFFSKLPHTIYFSKSRIFV